MLGRGLTMQTIKQRSQLMKRFQEFTGEFPWQWRSADVDDLLAGLRFGEKPISLNTLRSYSNAVATQPLKCQDEATLVLQDETHRPALLSTAVARCATVCEMVVAFGPPRITHAQ